MGQEEGSYGAQVFEVEDGDVVGAECRGVAGCGDGSGDLSRGEGGGVVRLKGFGATFSGADLFVRLWGLEGGQFYVHRFCDVGIMMQGLPVPERDGSVWGDVGVFIVEGVDGLPE